MCNECTAGPLRIVPHARAAGCSRPRRYRPAVEGQPSEHTPRVRERSAGSVRRVAGTAIWELKTIVAEHPVVAVPLARLRGHGEVVDDSTEIVIEAFARSAQSYAVAAFRLAQEPHAVRIAHHTHSPSNMIAGIRRRTPCLLIIRRPEDAILSYVIKTPATPVSAALRGYVRFHRTLLAHRSDLVVGTFEQITDDFASVIARVNERFGSSFGEFEPTEANVARVFREIDDDWKKRGRNEDERERGVPRPSRSREQQKARMLAAYRDPRLRASRERADRLYATFAALAGA
jgi:hypothetical protein